MKHQWQLPEYDEANPPAETIGTCSRCGAGVKIDIGPHSGSRQHYRWTDEAPWTAAKLGACPSNQAAQFRVVRVSHAFVRMIVIRKGRGVYTDKNAVRGCDTLVTPWAARHLWEQSPTAFGGIVAHTGIPTHFTDDRLDYEDFGDVARHQCREQAQYASRGIDGRLGYPHHGVGLRFRRQHSRANGDDTVDAADYHNILIHRDDVAEFVRRWKAHKEGVAS